MHDPVVCKSFKTMKTFIQSIGSPQPDPLLAMLFLDVFMSRAHLASQTKRTAAVNEYARHFRQILSNTIVYLDGFKPYNTRFPIAFSAHFFFLLCKSLIL